MSSPSLPPTHEHPMWQAWDLAAESCLSQLPALLAAEDGTGPAFEYRHSTFFAEQLTAFEVWLRKGPISKTPPQQLPIVLQVLLSQIHRLRALMLLSRFLDLGPWAVNLALSVGIFPYVLKLLQSPAQELKLVLVFIWAKILAVDRACQTDLLKDNGYTYFISILSSSTSTAASTTLTSSSSNPATTSSQQQSSSNSSSSIPNISEHRAMCVFILAVFCKGFRAGQEACLKTDLLAALAMHLTDPDPLLRQWVCLCYAACWDGYPDAKWTAMRESVHERLVHLTTLDPAPEVRCAALRALATLFGQLDKTEQIVKVEHDISMSVEIARNDASPLVRRELVHVFFRVIREYFPKFVAAAFEVWEDDRRKRGMMGGSSGGGGTTLSLGHSASSKLLGISTADDKRSRRSTIHGASEDIKQIVNSKSVSSSSNLSSSVSPAKNSLVSASPSSATTTTLSDNFDSSSPMARSAKFIVGANNGGTSSSLMLKKSLDSLTAASTTSKTVTTTTTDGLGAASSSSNSIYGCVYNALLTLSVDPMPEVAFLACKVVDSINTKMRATLIDPAMIASSPQPLSASSSKDLQQNQNHHQQSLRNVNTTTASSTLSAEDRRLTGSPGHTSPHFTTLPTNRSTIIGSSANNNSTATSSTALRKSASFAYSLRNLTGFWGSNGALSSSGTAQTSSNSQSTATVTATTSSGGTTSTTSGTRANSPKRDAGVSSSHHNPALPTSPAMMANQSFPLFAGGNGMAPLELNASSRSSFNGSQDSSGNGRASIIQQPSHSQQQISAAIGEIDMEDSGFFEWSCEYFAEPQMRVKNLEDQFFLISPSFLYSSF